MDRRSIETYGHGDGMMRWQRPLKRREGVTRYGTRPNQ